MDIDILADIFHSCAEGCVETRNKRESNEIASNVFHGVINQDFREHFYGFNYRSWSYYNYIIPELSPYIFKRKHNFSRGNQLC